VGSGMMESSARQEPSVLPVGKFADNGDPVVVRPGVFLSNQRARRTRLTPQRRRALADLGLDWAQ
jgi:hypothetical protein